MENDELVTTLQDTMSDYLNGNIQEDLKFNIEFNNDTDTVTVTEKPIEIVKEDTVSDEKEIEVLGDKKAYDENVSSSVAVTSERNSVASDGVSTFDVVIFIGLIVLIVLTVIKRIKVKNNG